MQFEAGDFDQHDPEVAGDLIWERYRQLRSQCPVAHSDAHGGFYFMTGFEEVRAAAMQHEVFSSAEGVVLPQDPRPMFVPLEYDPPEHSRWRRLMNENLSPSAVKRLEDQIRESVTRRIDAFAPVGRCDLVADFAAQIPPEMIADMLGIDGRDRDTMVQFTHQFFATLGTEAFATYQASFNEFILEQGADRRANPRHDYLTKLVTGGPDTEAIDDIGLISVVSSFLIGGYHSTIAGLASVLYHVGRLDDVRQKLLADPSLIPGAVEEAIRISTPLHSFRRVATTDTAVDDVKIPAGSDVLLCFAAANRDESAFPDPDEFDITRPLNTHLGYGWGIHRCLGIHLARFEMRIALEEVLRRIPDYRLAEGIDYGPLQAGLVMIVPSLPVTFTPVG